MSSTEAATLESSLIIYILLQRYSKALQALIARYSYYWMYLQ